MTIAYNAFEHATEELPDAIMLSWCSKCTTVQFHDVNEGEPPAMPLRPRKWTELTCWQCYQTTIHDEASIEHELGKQGQYSEDYFQDLAE